MRFFWLYLLLFLSFLELKAQNFSGGFSFPLSVYDTSTGSFLPSFPAVSITDAMRISAASDGTFQAGGTTIRFWGVNLAAAGNFPEKNEAALLARRMRKMGINLVRLHHLDNPAWFGSNSSILMNNGNTHELNPVALDKLDFLIAEFKKNGIYINLNLNVSRTFQAGDGVVAADSIQDFGKAITLFDPWMRTLQKEFAEQVLTHVNPYTGLSLAEDPVLAMVETNNENTLYGYWRGDYLTTFDEGGILPVFYNAELDAFWHTWLSEKYEGSSRKMADAWNGGLVPSGFGELLSNSGFETGNLGPDWYVFAQNGAVASGSITTTNPDEGTYAALVQSTTLGTNNYDIQLMQTGFSLKQDTTYTLFFRAKASTNAQLSALVQKDASPYNTYGYQTFNLTADWQTFEILVQPDEDLTNLAKVAFFPENSADYQIDAVSLRPLYQAPTASLADQISNGDFETGLVSPWQLEQYAPAAANFSTTNTNPQAGNFAGILDVSAVSGTDWHIQLKTVGSSVQKDSSYQLRFYARAGAGTPNFSITFMNDVAPYNWYAGSTQTLSTTWQEYVISFTAPEDNPSNLRISFSPLQHTGQIYFDEVRFGKPIPTGFLEGESLQAERVQRVLYSERSQFSDARVSDLAAFYTELEKNHLDSMYVCVKTELNTQVPITGSNALVGHQDVFRHKDMDYIDDHAYWDHPTFPNNDFDPNNFFISNNPMVSSPYFDAISNMVSGFSMAEKPYTISEYNHAAPNRYRTEMVPALAAYSAFHGVDGIMFFEYETDFDWSTNRINGIFSLNQDHSVMALFPSVAYAYRKGYIKEDPNPIVIDYNPDWVYQTHKWDNNGRWGAYHPFSPTLGLEHAIHTGTFSNPNPPDFSQLPSTSLGTTKTTATSETVLNTNDGILTTATPKYASITGFLQNAGGTSAGALELVSANHFGALTWISLTDTSLEQSQKSLLSISSVQQNTNMTWLGTTSLSNWGEAPSMQFAMQTDLKLHIEADEICIYPLDEKGDTLTACQSYLPSSTGYFEISIDQNQSKTLWYGIKATSNTTHVAAPKCFGVRIFPNPTQQMLRTEVDLKTSSPLFLEIHNPQGQLVFSKNYGKMTAEKQLIELDLSKFSKGLYFCTFQAEGLRVVEKVEKF